MSEMTEFPPSSPPPEEKRQPDASRPTLTPWGHILVSLLIITGMAVFLYPHTASWFSQKEQSRVTAQGLEQMQQPPLNNVNYRSEDIERARAYNEALASGAVLEAGANIATGEGTTADDSFVYEDLLRVNDEGFMGRLRYSSLDIDLPIYHGTEEETLLHGIGHLEGTSLPVGGADTRSVLTAHRGLPTATLFNELDRAEVGDIITLSIMGEVFSYRVYETEVISPDDTQAILPQADRDLLTLITCTPLGINSHRILVNAERITPTPEKEVEAATAVPDLPGFPWWAPAFLVTVLAMIIYLWQAVRSRRRARARWDEHTGAAEDV